MVIAFNSSTLSIPDEHYYPTHVAIIMDGNGRWAKKRFLPRIAGHHKGVVAVRSIIRYCIDHNISYLTLFAFSSENWRRPVEEVQLLMELFTHVLQREVDKLNANGVRLRVIGDLSRFDPNLQGLISSAEKQTELNSKLNLTIAANYGGRWDIVQAVNRLQQSSPNQEGGWTESDLASQLSMNFAPEPDLFIRTGGEERVSNFLLWQLAYSEFYFTKTLWPDFDATAMSRAIESYSKRERRFGRTSEQLKA